MRVILITCLAAMVIPAITYDGESKIKRSTSDETFEERLKEGNRLLNHERNADDTMVFLEKLHEMEGEMKEQYNSSPQPSPEVLEELKKYADSLNDNILPREGGSIEEVNEQSKVAPALFQGDMLLTKEQADELLEDVKENELHHNN